MRPQFAVVSILLASLLVLASVSTAEAQWDALSSGYAVTTNWHGRDVPVGQSVMAVAGWAPSLAPPRDSRVMTVEFRWLFPNGSVFRSPRVPIFGPITTPNVPTGAPMEIVDWAIKYPGVQVWYANNTQIPTVIGDWGVQAIFHDSGRVMGMNSDAVKVRATSFNVVPEVPFGTIVILLSWVGILGVFALRRKHLHSGILA